MRRFSISDKLILASFLLSVIIISIVASYSFYNAKNAILQRTFNQLTSVRVIKAKSIEKFLTACAKEVQLIKSSSDIRDLVKQINQSKKDELFVASSSSRLNYNKAFIENITKEYYSGISIVGNNGLIFPLKVPKVSRQYDTLLWNKFINTDTLLISDLTKVSNDSLPVILITTGIKNLENKTIGVLVFEVSVNSINSIMLEKDASTGLGETGESYLVGSDFLMRSTSRFQPNSILQTQVKTKAALKAFNGKSGTEIINDYRGIPVLSSYSKLNLPYLDWVILSEMDYDEATIPIYKIRNEIVFVSIFIFLIVIVVVIILSRRITIPIQKLNNAVQEIGEANFDIRLEHKLGDEVGELMTSFNEMAGKLKEQKAELEVMRMRSLQALMDGQETERQRLSREIHDSIGQLLIALKLKYESCIYTLDKKESKSLIDLGNLFDKTIEETRRISNNLRPAALTEFGLFSAVRNVCNVLAETTDLNIQLNLKGNANILDIQQETYIFRIVQEALTNIVKHAEASEIKVSINFRPNQLSLMIQDNGKGFQLKRINLASSNGIANIYDRVSLLGGKVYFDSHRSRGTKIKISIPFIEKK